MKQNENFSLILKQLPIKEIENFFILVDKELFEKLSDRLDVHEYCKKLHTHALHFSIFKGSELVGFSPCYFNNDNEGRVYISALVVRKKFQGKGLKQLLLNSIKKSAKEKKFTEIVVSFHCDNYESIKFYEANLFKKYTQNGQLCVFKLSQL